MATAKPAKPAETKTDAAPAKDSKDPTYAEQATDLATHAEQVTNELTEALDDLTDHHTKVQQTTAAPDSADLPTADAVRRLPMAIDEVRRALATLRQATGELTQRTQ